MEKLKIYCCHPISGLSSDAVFEYYEYIESVLTEYGYNVFTPMHGKDILRTELEFKSADYRNPVSTNHAIFNRDRWMVGQADVVYANLFGTARVSIGAVMELAWASDLHKHVVLCVEEFNIHRHAFVLEAADVVFAEASEALHYLKQLTGKVKQDSQAREIT